MLPGEIDVDKRLTKDSLEELQEWVADKEGIYVENQLLLTGKGKAVRAQSLALEVGRS